MCNVWYDLVSCSSGGLKAAIGNVFLCYIVGVVGSGGCVAYEGMCK